MSEKEPKRFYVCIYSKDDVAIGHIVSPEGEFPDEMHGAKPESEKETSDDWGGKSSAYSDRFQEFCNVMMGYVEFFPPIIAVGSVMSKGLLLDALHHFVKQNADQTTDLGNRIVYGVPSRFYPEFSRIGDSLHAATSTSRDLPRMLTVGLVSSYEYQLSLLMREVARSRYQAIFAKRTISAQDVLAASSIEELKETVITQEISEALRLSVEEQLGWIEKFLSLEPISTNYASFPQLMEIFARRNLFTHAGGIVSEQYIRASKKYGFVGQNNVNIGDELRVGPKYFARAVETVFDFGARLIQVIWRKAHPEESSEADECLNDFCFQLIERGQYRLASSLLEFGVGLRGHSSEQMRRMLVVNYANSLRLRGDVEAAEGILSKEDWSASDDKFHLCVAAVRGDVAEVISRMERIGADADVGILEYQEWPVFYHVRDDKEFQKRFKDVFGVDYQGAPKDKRSIKFIASQMREAMTKAQRDEGEQSEQSPGDTATVH